MMRVFRGRTFISIRRYEQLPIIGENAMVFRLDVGLSVRFFAIFCCQSVDDADLRIGAVQNGISGYRLATAFAG